MASKKAAKTSKLSKSKDYNTLVLNDVLCPICRSILVEPVTLPCNHDFCLCCFDGTMENANLVCPLCRLRIGSWLRKVRKENNLINRELWKTIKDRFPEHVNNKLSGLDENMEEEQREIIVAYPGEIRKEYERQKQKDDEEQRKKRESELKASEELIMKLKEEERFQKAVMEEKLKFDESVAKKLEKEEMASKQASTSKMKVTSKRVGPMDKFIKKEDETPTINPNSFVNKEYTCRVLCLDSKPTQESSTKDFSPKIQKKIQQIQKIVDLDMASDGSDCIESEMRYFKPIDHRHNPPTQRKPPLKITPKKLHKNAAAKVLSPGGAINFSTNILESAFASFSVELPKSSSISSSTLTTLKPLCSKRPSIKRTLSPSGVNFDTPDKKLKLLEPTSNIIEITDNEDVSRSNTINLTSSTDLSPTLNCSTVIRKKLFGGVQNTEETSVESPPFYGFRNAENKGKKPVQKCSVTQTNNVRKNGGFIDKQSLADKLKKDQEKADLEFAKRLQEEFDNGRYMRSSRRVGVSKRQSTLDEMIKNPYRVK